MTHADPDGTGSSRGRPWKTEGPESEWKVRLPRAERVARTFSAFANGVGGELWVGVHDSGEAAGVDDPAAVEDELRRIALTLVDPPIELVLGRHREEHDVLVVARVSPAPPDQRPVRAFNGRGEARAYLRDGDATRPAPAGVLRAWRNPPARARSIDAKSRRILCLILDRPGATLTELARAFRMGQRSLRRLLVPLARAGLVTEEPGRRFTLTPQGRRLARR